MTSPQVDYRLKLTGGKIAIIRENRIAAHVPASATVQQVAKLLRSLNREGQGEK